jgi:hypothetical protein
MKVRCVKLIDSRNQPTDRSPWLTLGKTYDVLSVVLDAQCDWWLRLVGDEDAHVGLFRLEQFEVLTARIPRAWIASWSSAGTFELSPQAWLVPGFWERFFERDKGANEEFDRERNDILQSEI